MAREALPSAAPRRHPAQLRVPLAASAAAVVLLAACGSSAPPPPWRSGHPDPASLRLLSSGQAGSCAASAPYPSQAPTAIDLAGQEYVQSARLPANPQPPGAVEIDHTGDWAFFQDADGSLTLTTAQADYRYTAGRC
jgi:hypothetical protein